MATVGFKGLRRYVLMVVWFLLKNEYSFMIQMNAHLLLSTTKSGDNAIFSVRLFIGLVMHRITPKFVDGFG